MKGSSPCATAGIVQAGPEPFRLQREWPGDIQQFGANDCLRWRDDASGIKPALIVAGQALSERGIRGIEDVAAEIALEIAQQRAFAVAADFKTVQAALLRERVGI